MRFPVSALNCFSQAIVADRTLRVFPVPVGLSNKQLSPFFRESMIYKKEQVSPKNFNLKLLYDFYKNFFHHFDLAIVRFGKWKIHVYSFDINYMSFHW